MLETIAERPCDTKFRWDADDGRPCEEFIKSPVCEWETPCMLPMFSIVSSIVERLFLSASPPALSLSVTHTRSPCVHTLSQTLCVEKRFPAENDFKGSPLIPSLCPQSSMV